MNIDNNENIKVFITIAIALSCGFSAAIGFGLISPLFALRMDDYGISDSIIGLLVAIIGISPLIFTPLLPWLMTKIPVKNALIGAIIISSFLYLLLIIANSPFVWVISRFCFATLGTFLFVGAESWILEIAPEKYRGRIFGIYAMVFYGGIGIGGFLISFIGYNNDLIIYIAIIMNLAVLPLFLIKTIDATPPKETNNGYKLIINCFLAAPILFIPAFAIGSIETAAFNLFPIWTRNHGFEDNIAGLILSCAAIGNVILQGPVGIMADKYGRIKTLIFIGIIATVFPFIMLLTNEIYLILFLVGIWSGFVTGFYTLGLMGLAEGFDTKDIAGANATFGTIYCVGQLIAPFIAGYMMEVLGNQFLLVCLGVFGFLPLIAIFLKSKTVNTG